jgi:hypothetical protein
MRCVRPVIRRLRVTWGAVEGADFAYLRNRLHLHASNPGADGATLACACGRLEKSAADCGGARLHAFAIVGGSAAAGVWRRSRGRRAPGLVVAARKGSGAHSWVQVARRSWNGPHLRTDRHPSDSTPETPPGNLTGRSRRWVPSPPTPRRSLGDVLIGSGHQGASTRRTVVRSISLRCSAS